MAEISKFFDSTQNDERVYTAADFAGYYAMFYSKGVINTETYPNSLAVTKSGGKQVTVAPGCAIIGGYQYINNSNKTLSVTESEGYIVLQLDATNRKIAAVATGTTTYVNTEVKLAYYKVTNGVISTLTDSRIYSKALYTHDFDTMQADVNAAVASVNATLPTLQAQVDSKLNSISGDLLNLLAPVDGTGSGLDADLLDGQQGSYYLNYNNFTNAPKILYGTAEPSTAQGKNGDIYILYEG